MKEELESRNAKLGEAKCISAPTVLWFLLPYVSQWLYKIISSVLCNTWWRLMLKVWDQKKKKHLEFVLQIVLQRWRSWSPRSPSMQQPGMCSPRWQCSVKAGTAQLEVPMPLKHLVSRTHLQNQWHMAALSEQQQLSGAIDTVWPSLQNKFPLESLFFLGVWFLFSLLFFH